MEIALKRVFGTALLQCNSPFISLSLSFLSQTQQQQQQQTSFLGYKKGRQDGARQL